MPAAILKSFQFLSFIIITIFVGTSQKASAQKSTIDSIQFSLINFETNLKDTIVLKMAGEPRSLLQKDSINNTLAKELNEIEDYLFKTSLVSRKSLLQYFIPAVHLIEEQPGITPKIKATSLNQLAYLYSTEQEYDKVAPLYDEALTLIKNTVGENDLDYADILINKASFYSDIGEPAKALNGYLRGIDIQKKTIGENNVNYAGSLNSLGLLYTYANEYTKALPLFEKSIAIYKLLVGDHDPVYADAINNLAIMYESTGLYVKALQLYLQVLEIDKKTVNEDIRDKAAGFSNIANVYEDMGEYEKALPLYIQALSQLEKDPGRESPDYATSLDNLGYLYEDMGLLKEAFIYYKQALDIRKKVLGVENPEYAGSLNNIANIYKKQKNYNLAILYYHRAAEIIKKTFTENNANYATALQNLGNLYSLKHMFSNALPLLEQSLDIRKKLFGENHREYALSLVGLAFYYKSKKEFNRAKSLTEQAVAIQKTAIGNENPEYIRSLEDLGILYLLLDKQKKAAELITNANRIQFKNIVRENSTLSYREKMDLIDAQSKHFDLLPSIIYSKKLMDSGIVDQLYSNALVLKGMLLHDQENMQRRVNNSRDSISRRIYDQWLFNKSVLGKQLLTPKSKQIIKIDSLENATDELERELSQRSSAFNQQQLAQSVTVDAVKGKLAAREAAIEFIQFHLFNQEWTDSIIYAALILKQGEPVHFVPLFEEKQLQNLLINKYGSNYSSYKIRQLYPGVNKAEGTKGLTVDPLYKLIWKPLEKYLAGVTSIYFAPTGLLNRIAFGAMQIDPTHLLIDKYYLIRVLSTRSVVIDAQSREKISSADIWANIQYGDLQDRDGSSFIRDSTNYPNTSNILTKKTAGLTRGTIVNPLGGTLLEMDSLQYIFQKAGINVRVDSGASATEEKFKAIDGTSRQILHLATHGFFLAPPEKKVSNSLTGASALNAFSLQENPMLRSGLILAGGNEAWTGKPTLPGREDGILTAYEISQLDLSNTKLVVLSACETGLGDLRGNEEVIGLERAFKITGARQIIMSLWQVPDKETVELMTLFYKFLLRGSPTEEALRTAQLKMKEKYPPFYWAGFIEME